MSVAINYLMTSDFQVDLVVMQAKVDFQMQEVKRQNQYLFHAQGVYYLFR